MSRGDIELGLLGAAELSSAAATTPSGCSRPSLDASGEGTLGVPRSVVDAHEHPLQVALEDRGVRGAFLRCGDMELPLGFADIHCEGSAITVTVHEGVHPGCAHKGKPISLNCASAEDAKSWQLEMEQANELVDNKQWGVSKSFISEQRDRWEAEGMRCKGMTVAEYFEDIGLGAVYDETWAWCASVLDSLEKEASLDFSTESRALTREISYYRAKVQKTELYENMELTDYMNVLKHRDLVPAGQQVSYADFIAAESDSSGRRKVGTATVFVSHVWKMEAADFFEVCINEMEEDDYGWIDIYLHNQYQGAVSSIGDENSEYWITKFGSLIGGIGKVIAIVTDWERPVMLTRIWCLFELNAAIDTGAELKFVATAAQRMDLSLNLNEKFGSLGTLVKNIDVRACDAKRPHEVQDKKIFLGKLEGAEDDVNEKLRREMQRWLANAAQHVIHRTNPFRRPLDDTALAAEDADIGPGQCCTCEMLGISADHSFVLHACCPYPSAARLTRLLESWPWLGLGLMILGMLVLTAVMAGLPALGDSCLECSTSGYGYGDADEPAPVNQSSNDNTDATGWDILALFAVVVTFWTSFLLPFALGAHMMAHQKKRQLRRPPLLGARTTRHPTAVLLTWGVFWLLVAPFLMLRIGIDWGFGNFVIGLPFVVGIWMSLGEVRCTAITRAELCVQAGRLWLALGEYQAAMEIFEAAQKELLEVVGEANFMSDGVMKGDLSAADAARRAVSEAIVVAAARQSQSDARG